MSRARIRPTREETADRLVDGARKAFAEHSFHGATVEKICEAAGLTRGAFYSGFGSKEELFLALYDRVSLDVIDNLNTALTAATSTESDDPIDAVIRQTAKNYYLDREWYILNTEFTLLALRSDDVARVYTARRGALRAQMVTRIEQILERAGRRFTVEPELMVRAILGLADAGLGQSLLEPDKLGKWTLSEAFLGPLIKSCSERITSTLKS